jgi:hypothetical protein
MPMLIFLSLKCVDILTCLVTVPGHIFITVTVSLYRWETGLNLKMKLGPIRCVTYIVVGCIIYTCSSGCLQGRLGDIPAPDAT